MFGALFIMVWLSYNFRFGSVTSGIVTFQIPAEVVYVSHRSNKFEKAMNLTFLLSAMGKYLVGFNFGVETSLGERDLLIKAC